MTQFLKTCSKCRKQKWNSSFAKDKKRPDGLYSFCKDCKNKQHQKRYPERYRNTYLKHHYKITINQYELLLKKQKGVCAICGQSETRKQNNKILCLSVDHNHNTGQVRGLLCNKCNNALGNFNDNPETLRKAIKYLEEEHN